MQFGQTTVLLLSAVAFDLPFIIIIIIIIIIVIIIFYYVYAGYLKLYT